jgi:hypothetical protein
MREEKKHKRGHMVYGALSTTRNDRHMQCTLNFCFVCFVLQARMFWPLLSNIVYLLIKEDV